MPISEKMVFSLYRLVVSKNNCRSYRSEEIERMIAEFCESRIHEKNRGLSIYLSDFLEQVTCSKFCSTRGLSIYLQDFLNNFLVAKICSTSRKEQKFTHKKIALKIRRW